MLLLPFAYLSASQSPVEDLCHTKKIIKHILTYQTDSIAGADKDKLYLKAENIFHSQHGYVLYNGQSATPIPTVSFDENGAAFLFYGRQEEGRLQCSNPNCNLIWRIQDYWSAFCPRCGSIGNWVD